MEHADGQHGANKRRRGEICARPGRAQMAQAEDEHHQADAIAKEPDQRPTADYGG